MSTAKVFFLFLFCSFTAYSQTIYVNGSLPINGDGTSWATAFNNLDDAIAVSNLHTNEIWVAKGTYYPAKDRTGNPNPAANRTKTFHINKNLKLYGGFLGNELTISERIIGDNPTILSGDLGILNNDSDNSYNVISAIDFNVAEINNLVIDGFTIEKSNNNSYLLGGDSSGGGIIIKPNEDFIYSVQIRNSIFINNKSGNGGAICIKNSMKFVNTFKVSNCIFSDNFAINVGGAIFISSDAHCDYLKIPQCFNSSMNSIIENSIFNNNIANQGGAIYNISIGGNHSNIIYQCTFFNNEASQEGNAIYNAAVTWPYFAFCQAVISNSIFKDKQNDAFEIFNYQDSDYQIAGVQLNTFADLYNCLYINKLANIHFYVNTDEILSYSTSLCQEIDPLFVNESNPIGPDNKWRTADDGLRLKPCSPAINAGDNTFVPVDITTDIAGESRIQLGTVDIGAYESNSNTLPTMAIGNTSVTANQSNATFYYSDCDKLIAKVVSPPTSNGVIPIAGSTTAKVWFETKNIFYSNLILVSKHYEITPNINSANVEGDVIIYFSQEDFDAYNNHTGNQYNKLPKNPDDIFGKFNLKILKFPGESIDGTGHPNTYMGIKSYIFPQISDINWNYMESRWEVSFKSNGFSGFFVFTGYTLPLNLISFSAKQKNESTELNWKTADEVNTKSFEIERSKFTSEFTKIGTVASKNNTETNEYSFLDNQSKSQSSNILYYRLKMIDLDGKFTYSKIVTVTVESGKSIKISPNPTSGKATLNLGNKSELINTMTTITNASGMVVKQFKINKLKEEIDFSFLSKAVYLIKFVDGSVVKLVKE